MRFIKNIFIILWICFVSNAFAQKIDVDIKWGQEMKDGNEDVWWLAGQDADNAYVLKTKEWGFFTRKEIKLSLEVFSNKTLALKSKTEINFKGNQLKGGSLLHNYNLNDKFLIIFSDYDPKADKNTLYAQYITKKGIAEPKYMELDYVLSNTKSDAGSFDVHLSRDSTKIIVMHNEKYKRNEPEKFSLRVFDTNLNLLWNRSITLPFKDKSILLSNIVGDEKGNVYVLAQYTPVKGEKDKGDAEYYYKIMAFSENIKEYTEFDIDLDKNYIEDITFDIDKQGNLVCAGFYKKNYFTEVSDGFFFVKIDGNTKQAITKSLNKIVDLYPRKSANPEKVKAKDRISYRIYEIIPKADGSYIVMGEQYMFYVLVYYDAKGNRRVEYHYIYNNIVAIKLKPDGMIEWVNRIPKRQHTVNDGGRHSGFLWGECKGKMFIIYNDDKDNVMQYDETKIETMKNVKRSVSMLHIIDEKGVAGKQMLFKNKELETWLRPKVFLRDAIENQFLILGETGRSYRIGQMIVK